MDAAQLSTITDAGVLRALVVEKLHEIALREQALAEHDKRLAEHDKRLAARDEIIRARDHQIESAPATTRSRC